MADAPGRRKRPQRTQSRSAADDERGLRGLVGAGPSQVGTSTAMRTRDAARPTAADEAAAERDLRVVRRSYVPPPPVPPSGSSGSTFDRS